MVDRLLLPDQRGHDFFKARDFFFRNRNTGTGFGEELLISGLGDVGLIDLFLEGTVVPVKAAVTDVRALCSFLQTCFSNWSQKALHRPQCLHSLYFFPAWQMVQIRNLGIWHSRRWMQALYPILPLPVLSVTECSLTS